MKSTAEDTAAADPLPTRERIMSEAADLFARKGYHGTTTREIADAVSIRQPSLFHHFATKAAIVSALLDWDLDLAVPRVYAIAGMPQSAPVRLYRYLLDDVTHLATAPFNLSGIYTEEVIGSSEFASRARRRDELHDVVEGIIAEGIAQGQFVAVDTNMIRHAIGGVLVRVITIHSGGRGTAATLADQIARLFLRGLLRDTGELDGVIREATLVGDP